MRALTVVWSLIQMILPILWYMLWAVSAYRIDYCPANLNQTKIHLQDKYEDTIQSDQKFKLHFVSKTNIPFELRLYTTDGVQLCYKGTDVSSTGHFTYYEIKNTGDQFNKILLEMRPIEKSSVRLLIGLFALVSIGILIIFKRDHYVSQAVLIILLMIEIWNTSDYERISEKVIKKYLF